MGSALTGPYVVGRRGPVSASCPTLGLLAATPSRAGCDATSASDRIAGFDHLKGASDLVETFERCRSRGSAAPCPLRRVDVNRHEKGFV